MVGDGCAICCCCELVEMEGRLVDGGEGCVGVCVEEVDQCVGGGFVEVGQQCSLMKT